MRYYETLYIVNPNYEQERFDSVLKTVGEYIEKEKVSIINHYTWGKKRLAYPIQKHKYGTFILLQFESEKVDFLSEYEQFLRLNKAVLRHQTVRLDEKPEIHVEEEPVVEEETTETAEVEKLEAETEVESPAKETPEESVEPVTEEVKEVEAEPTAAEEVSEEKEEEE